MTSTLLALLTASALLPTGTPFTMDGRVPIGVTTEAKPLFVAIEQEQVGDKTTFKVKAYRPPKGKKARVPLRPIVVDASDEEKEAATRAKAKDLQAKANEWFEKAGITSAPTLAGGLTGRFRLLDQGMVIAQEEDKVIIRSGDASVMKATVLIKSVTKVVGRCRGKAEGKVKHAVLMEDWSAVALFVEASCKPSSDKKQPRRVSRLFVKDLSKILPKGK